MRSGRHTTILDIISKQEIETQEELCAELNKHNYKVTQATVSRDIKELRLFKVAGTVKKYKWQLWNGKHGQSQDRPYPPLWT